MNKTSIVLASILSLILLVAIAVGGYLGGWWLKEDSVNRTQNIRRGSFEYQETRRDEIVRQASNLTDLDVALANPDLTAEQKGAIRAQREAARTQLCNIASDISGNVSPDVTSIVNEECFAQ